MVGAGTVLNEEQLTAACRAGASFLVSPHTDVSLLALAREHKVPFLAGALTPTEVVRAYQAGATCVKLFPGSAVGPGYLKALRGPLPHIPLMPTGGVDEKNLGEWLSAGAVAVGMGGNLATASPEHRVSNVLLKLAGTDEKDLPVRISLRREDIGRIAGLTTETTIRVVRRLADKKLLRIEHGKIFIDDPAPLRRYVGH